MKKIIDYKIRILMLLMCMAFVGFDSVAVSLWVGESYKWDFGGSVLGSTYNMSVTTNGGYLSVTGSGFYRNITPTQYFSGDATVTAEWDYTLYYGDTKKHKKVTLTVSCRENPVSISPTSITLSPGETYQLGYRHAYDNQYVGAANAYFSGGNSSFSVTSSGLVTAKAPGSGYVTVYSKVSSAANAPSCKVTVKDIEPSGATVKDLSLYADQTVDLNVSVSPSNASVKSKEWYVKSGDDVVSVSGSRLTGLKPGKAVIYCKVNGSVRSNDATVTVAEPDLKMASASPEDGADGVSVFTNPLVTFSHDISEGSGFKNIRLTGPAGEVEGTVEISSRELRFIPSKHLSPLTRYKFNVPRTAIVNKWGGNAESDVTVSFTTADLEKITLNMTPVSGSFITADGRITITAEPSDAKIYYTTDGTEPTPNSTLYTEPMELKEDMTVKAFAVRDGYKDSDVVTGEFYKSNSEITGYYPNDDLPLFNYLCVSPYLRLSGNVEKSNNFRRISLKDGNGNDVEGSAYITAYMIIFVPTEPLRNSTTYTMDIPRDAVKTVNGEVFVGFNWSFTTPTHTVGIGMRGDESVFVLEEDGTLKTRGLNYKDINLGEGSYGYNDLDVLSKYTDGVENLSCGYSHLLFEGESGVNGRGLAFCGENGKNGANNTIADVSSIKAGFQTSAIIDGDRNLWMCGRNDFYQLGDGTGTTMNDYVRVAENVIDVALGNGYTLYVDADNVLWGVGRNHRGQLGDGTTDNRRDPVKILENVAKVYASKSGFFSACVTTDGSLMTWGDNVSSQLGREAGKYSSTPERVMENVESASLGNAHVLALTDDYELYSWGSNRYGQIGSTTGNTFTPILMAKRVVKAEAGAETSLVLFADGAVKGWGRKTHSNFGSGDGKAEGFVVSEGLGGLELSKVFITPKKFEIEPETSIAIIALPNPLKSDYESVEWSSDHPEIVSVDERGVVTAGSHGTALITVRFTDRFGNVKEASAEITSTDNPINTGVDRTLVVGNSWTAYSKDNNIVIENARIGEEYTVYNLQGMVIDACHADNDRVVFPMNQSGIYLVGTSEKVVKVTCN